MMLWNRPGFISFFFAAFAVQAVLGDTLGTGSVGGTIRDETGGLVAGAKVALTDKSKGLTRESETDSSGLFIFPSVIAGEYSLRAEKAGFKTEQVDSLRVE